MVFCLKLLQCGIIFTFLVLHVLNGLGRLLFDALLLGHVDHLVRVSLEIPHFLERVLHLLSTFLQLLLLLLRLLMEQLGLRQNLQGFFAKHLIFVAPYHHHCFVHRVAHLEAHIVLILRKQTSDDLEKLCHLEEKSKKVLAVVSGSAQL